MEETFQAILDDIKRSEKAADILPIDPAVKKSLAEAYQIPSASLLGMLLENTGGLIIDHWIRFYGAGALNFVTRNALVPFRFPVIAEDILGGLFVYLEQGTIGYFAPDCLELEDMEINLSQFLYWCIHGDTDTFYASFRWEGWQEELSHLGCDEGMAFYPFLWAQAESLESRTRRIVPMEEIIRLEFDFWKQMNT